jgi:hypothetical protein
MRLRNKPPKRREHKILALIFILTFSFSTERATHRLLAYFDSIHRPLLPINNHNIIFLTHLKMLVCKGRTHTFVRKFLTELRSHFDRESKDVGLDCGRNFARRVLSTGEQGRVVDNFLKVF